MRGNYLFYALMVVAIFLMGWMLTDTFTQPGLDGLEGEYQEWAKYRNENNTGPVVRIYAVAVKAPLWEDMRAYGDLMPHTKYGRTQVFFFDADKVDIHNDLVLAPDAPYFPEDLRPFCLASYEKSAMGEVNFLKRPFQ